MPTTKHTLQENKNIVSVHFNAAFFFERGIRSLHRQDVLRALKYFQKCVELDCKNPTYLTHLAATYTEIEDYEQSNSILNCIVHDLDETLSDCYYYMANNCAHMGEFDQAEQYALLYLQEAPDGLYIEDAEELLDFICFELDRTPKELDMEHKLINKHEKARRCLEEGKFVEATRLLEEMVEEYPHFLAARNNLALAYYYLGQFEKAMQVIEDILSKDQANLHALCNLSVFFSHKGKDKEVNHLIQGLKKVYPIRVDQHYKLAITLGILGEDERAYELFMILIKRGLCEDTSLYHYVAVSAFNTQRWIQAEKFWLKLKELDPIQEIAEYYLEVVSSPSFRQGKNRLPYHYQLPYDVQFKKRDWFENGTIPKDILNDPLIRSSLLWSLRHGDTETKIQVIQTFQYLADHEVEEALQQIIQDPKEEDYVKKLAIFILRQLGVKPPFQAYIKGEWILADEAWIEKSISVDKLPLSSYDGPIREN